MSLKGYIVPVALIGLGVTAFGVPKVRDQIREIRDVREVHHAPRVTIMTDRASLALDQAGQADDWCRQYRSREARGWHCEVREYTIPASGDRLEIDAGGNGGINVQAWDRAEVLVRSKVQGQARNDDLAREIVSAVQIETSGTFIRARGPKTSGRDSWAVSFEVSVPNSSDLSLKTVNGGISVEGVSGNIEFDATNGGISLEGVSGGVRGRTTNGGIKVALTGDAWSGDGLDVKTTNGGIKLAIPENYNAVLESGTVNGRLQIDFPITVQGKIGRKIRTELGSGGPLIRAMTTNGGVEIRRGG